MGEPAAAPAAASSVVPKADISSAPPPLKAPLVITNRAPGQFDVQANSPLSLATQADIEAQLPNGTWATETGLDGGHGFHLTDSCSAVIPSCRAFTAGEELYLAAWTGSSCSSQCASPCPIDSFRPGTHRLVLHACSDPKLRFEGAPFEMAASARELWRWRAAEGIRGGQVFRLEPLAFDNKNEGPPRYIAGFGVLKGSAQPLSPARLGEISAWLRSKESFVQYELNKRCMQGHLVGLLLDVATPRAEERTVEIALNLACNSAFITLSDARGRVTHVSHFDPSWATVIAIVHRALPFDAELAALHESGSNLPANFDRPSHEGGR